MRESIGELTVVGEDEQTRRIKIKSTDAIEARPRRMINQVNRARTSFGIAVGAHGSARLEEHDRDVLLRFAQRASVNLDAILVGIHPRGQHVHRLAVHGDRAVTHQFFALAPRRNARVGQHLLQACSAIFVGVIVRSNFACAGRAFTGHGRSVRVDRMSASEQSSSRYPVAMPIYEYEAVEDGEVIELMRSMKDADVPVEDPQQRGRIFRRRLSVFGVAGSASASAPQTASTGHVHSSGCGCGRPMGSCGNS